MVVVVLIMAIEVIVCRRIGVVGGRRKQEE